MSSSSPSTQQTTVTNKSSSSSGRTAQSSGGTSLISGLGGNATPRFHSKMYHASTPRQAANSATSSLSFRGSQNGSSSTILTGGGGENASPDRGRESVGCAALFSMNRSLQDPSFGLASLTLAIGDSGASPAASALHAQHDSLFRSASSNNMAHASHAVNVRDELIAVDDVSTVLRDIDSSSSHLGRGASASVKAMRHVETGQLVAVKLISPFGAEMKEILIRELVILNALRRVNQLGHMHTNNGTASQAAAPGQQQQLSSCNSDRDNEEMQPAALVHPLGRHYVMEAGLAYFSCSTVYLVMEKLDGSLFGLAPMPEPVLSCLARAVALGMSFLHEDLRILHRDFKPSNLLFKRNGEVRIADFGMSTLLRPGASCSQSFLGSLLYMSPERVRGESYTAASDWFSVGISLIQIFLGRHPYQQPMGATFEAPSDMRFWGVMELMADDCAVLRQSIRTQLRGASPAMLDFIESCLNLVPSQPPTPERLLHHPWLTATMEGYSNMNELLSDEAAILAEFFAGQ